MKFAVDNIKAEYTFENDENGTLIMLANQEGIKNFKKK